MKRCPSCHRTYTDTTLRFCLDDGSSLLLEGANDPQETLRINVPRSTNPTQTEVLHSDKVPTSQLIQPVGKRNLLPWMLVAALFGALLSLILVLFMSRDQKQEKDDNSQTMAKPARAQPKVESQEVPAPTIATTTSSVTIYANQGWQDTGIVVRSGSTVTFEYLSGSWTTAKGAHPYVGPNGNKDIGDPKNPNHPLPSAYPGVLIGKVGDGIVQEIGTSRSLHATSSGKIYMRMNDDGLMDNDGYVVIRVRVQSS